MEKIQGMVSDIVFKNEENGYTIANLANEDDEITIVGCMPTLSMGESIEVEGKWINHKIYGSQFEVQSFMPVTPSSLEGIYVYLSSGMIHGIGEKNLDITQFPKDFYKKSTKSVASVSIDDNANVGAKDISQYTYERFKPQQKLNSLYLLYKYYFISSGIFLVFQWSILFGFVFK